MSGKIYAGEKDRYRQLNDNKLGSGGNGRVYEVEKMPDGQKGYVIKIFYYSSHLPQELRKLRYERFCQEVDFLEKEGKYIQGIIPIKDKHLPASPCCGNEAWYIMPKAKSFKLNQYTTLLEKLQNMLDLAYTLRELHKKGIAHRDIKPSNILIYKGKVCLCDFGLIWGYKDCRLTFTTERIGPVNILPPELNPVKTEVDIDYTPSDVYLFAKVLWMLIKENEYGFKGPYRRDWKQCYLRKEEYTVATLEPIHQLLEKSTEDEIEKRINIQECIDLIQQQINVIQFEREQNNNWKNKIRGYIYLENTKEILSRVEPDHKEYMDQNTITQVLSGIINNSEIFIYDMGREYKTGITDFMRVTKNQYYLREYTKNRTLVMEYRIQVQKMVYETNNKTIRLILDNYARNGVETNATNIRYLSPNHTIVFLSPNTYESVFL